MDALAALNLPYRLAARGVADARRVADAASALGDLARELTARVPGVADALGEAVLTLVSLRDEIRGVRRSLTADLDAIRAVFEATNAELETLRHQLVPVLAGVEASTAGLHVEVAGQREAIDALRAELERLSHSLTAEIASLNGSLAPIARDADEIRRVIEPLETATERLGRLAERMPGPRRRRPPRLGARPRAALPAARG